MKMIFECRSNILLLSMQWSKPYTKCYLSIHFYKIIASWIKFSSFSLSLFLYLHTQRMKEWQICTTFRHGGILHFQDLLYLILFLLLYIFIYSVGWQQWQSANPARIHVIKMNFLGYKNEWMCKREHEWKKTVLAYPSI